MLELIIHWVVSAVSLIIVAQIFTTITVKSFGTALIAAIIIGLVNATLGLVLQIFFIPITILTLGAFYLVINALMLWVSSLLVPGFKVKGFMTIFFGAIVLSIVSAALRYVVFTLPNRNLPGTF